MKKALVGIGIICFLLTAFLFARPYIFGESDGEGQYVAGSLAEEEPDAASVVASAVNPTKVPVQAEPTATPDATPTVEPTLLPENPTPTPKAEQQPAKEPVVTATPNPTVTESPKESDTVTDEDIEYVAGLLEVPEDKVREVVERAEAEGYNLNPEEIMKGDFDILGAWGIVTDVFGKQEAAKLLMKVMKLGIFE